MFARGGFDLVIEKNLALHGVLVRPERRRLRIIAELIDRGDLRVLLRQTFPLAQGGDAHALVQTRHGGGKIVLCVCAPRGCISDMACADARRLDDAWSGRRG